MDPIHGPMPGRRCLVLRAIAFAAITLGIVASVYLILIVAAALILGSHAD
jgi:hypothetical protein